VTEGEARIQLGDREVIIGQDEAFLVDGHIPHAVWNNSDGITKMIGISVIK
jgi:mannose-6-phosphate isomerase-like protein (cupin superfamily)